MAFAGLVLVHGAGREDGTRSTSWTATAFLALLSVSAIVVMPDNPGAYAGALLAAAVAALLELSRNGGRGACSAELDRVLPSWDFNEVHQIEVEASVEETMKAVRELRPGELSWLVTAMFAVRAIPMLLRGKRPPSNPSDRPFLEQMASDGFLMLGGSDREIVFGLAGKFWTPVPTLPTLRTREEYLAFAEPGNAKVAANLAAAPSNGRTLLTTETRIHCLDSEARRSFGRYWALIRLGSGWIRVLWLRAIKRRAERASRG
ncbi:MAG: hypothetical protein QM765_33405 [Myxococcales bacterium]